MQLTPLQGPIFDRLVKTNTGIYVRVSFVVVARDGQYVPQILSIHHLDGRPYNPAQPEAQVVLSLPVEIKNTVVEVVKNIGDNYKKIVFAVDDLFFFNGQLIRGPSKN